jgi:hypothetical protein
MRNMSQPLDEDKVLKCLPDELDKLDERRIHTMAAYFMRNKTFEDVAKEFGVSVHAIRNDWERRSTWLPQLLLFDDVKELTTGLLAKWVIYLWECANMARRFDKDGNKHAANEAMKNYREGLTNLTDIAQSIGMIPKVALELQVIEAAERLLKQKDQERRDRERATSLH